MPIVIEALEASVESVFDVVLEGLPRGSVVRSLRGTEALSRPFRFDVELLVPTPDRALEQSLLGRAAEVVLRQASGVDEPRRFLGLVVRAELDADVVRGVERSMHRLRLRVGPRLALLARDRSSRVFQNRTVPQIVQQVLEGYGIRCVHELALEHEPRAYVLQYQESSLRFVERLLGEVGIQYVVETRDDAAVVRLFDAPSTVKPVEPSAPIPFDASAGLGAARAAITSLERSARVRPTHVVLTEFDEKHPTHELEASGQVDPTHDLVEHYDHHGEHVGLDVHRRAAETKLRTLRRRARSARGTSRAPQLAAGRSFRLEGSPEGGADAEYTLLEVRHVARAPELFDAPVLAYENRFSCVERGGWPRARGAERRHQEVLLTGTVVGPAGQEIHTDELGRVRVQFHWDREGARNETSSCWIRVAQSWAGPGYGFQFIPRVGMEVVVGFLGGDVDRPLVLGCMPNAVMVPPFVLPRERSRSGIRSQSTPGGPGFNELSFEDRRGYERVHLRAERDLEEVVQHDRHADVGRDRHTRVGHDDLVQVGHDRMLVVDGQLVDVVERDHTSTVAGARRSTVDGDRAESTGRDKRVDVTGSLETRVGGFEHRDIAGPAVHRHGARLQVEAADTLGLSSHREVVVAAPRLASLVDALEVAATTSMRAVVGTDDRGASWEVTSEGEGRATLDRSLRVASGEAITLRVGATVVTITDEGIDVSAKRVTIGGEDLRLVTDRASLRIDDRIQAAAKELRLSSAADATLELGAEAKLDGARIALGSAAAAEKVLRKEREEKAPTTPKLTVHLFDDAGEPARGHYELSMPGYTQRGSVSGGTVAVPAFPGADTCRIRWGATSEEGPFPFERVVYLGFPEDEDEALRRKLSNLGHDAADLRAAVTAFEAKTGKAVTGTLERVRDHVDDHHRTATSVKVASTKEQP